MSRPTVAVIRGDGIGPEVIEAALEVVAATGFVADYVEAEAGYACFRRRGEPLPRATLECARRADAVLFGAITTPTGRPGYPSAIVTLRRELGLYANLRPFRTVPGLGRYGDEDVDVLVVRENSEGLYVQHGWREADRAYNVLRRTTAACRRVLELACRQAQARSGALTVVHKANVVKPADELWLEVAQEVTQMFPVRCAFEIVDALCLKLVLDPGAFDVIVAPNLYGDILSDLLAGIVGGLGLCPSANLGAEHALFEPVHGSAPDLAGRGIANPIGAVLSAAWMLEHLGDRRRADAVRAAVARVLESPVRPPDLGGSATTRELTRALIAALPSR